MPRGNSYIEGSELTIFALSTVRLETPGTFAVSGFNSFLICVSRYAEDLICVHALVIGIVVSTHIPFGRHTCKAVVAKAGPSLHEQVLRVESVTKPKGTVVLMC
jgi:hypothetical protein